MARKKRVGWRVGDRSGHLELEHKYQTRKGFKWLCFCHGCQTMVVLEEAQLSCRRSCGCGRDAVEVGAARNGRLLVEKNVKGSGIHLWECTSCGGRHVMKSASVKERTCSCLKESLTVTVQGRTFTYAEAAQHFNINPNTLRARIRHGWTAHQAVGLDTRPRDKKALVGSTGMTFAQLCEKNGVNISTARNRQALGWSDLEAVGEAPRGK